MHRVFSLTSISMLVMCVLLIYLVFISPPQLFTPPQASMVLSNAERAIGVYAEVADLDSADWRAIKLPDDWRHQELASTEAWYRFRFQAPETTSSDLSLYIPTIRQNSAVYLNGYWVGQGGEFSPNTAHLWYHPQRYQFSSSLLHSDNTLYLKLATSRRHSGYLSRVYLGEDQKIKPAWQWRNFFKVTLVEISSVLLIVVGLINLYLWQLRRKDSYYLWYALAALCWSLRGYVLIEPVLNVSNEARVLLRILTLGYGVVFVVLFNLRYFGFKSKKLDWALFLYCVPAALPMFFMGMEELRFYGHQIWVRGNLVLGVFVAIFLMTQYIWHNKKDAILILFGGMPLLIIGVRDMLVLNDKWPPENGFLINHLTLPALVIAMWFILRRLSSSLKHSEELNVTLESRILSKEMEIKESYRQQQELKQQQVVSQERERIMRDMHDGLGGYLVGLKSLLDAKSPSTNDIKNYVNLALVDLRLVINSLDVTSQNLSSLLGAMRNRWQLLAESNDRNLLWEVTRASIQHQFGPSRTLDIMRILEEAFTNSLKHGEKGDIHLISGESADGSYLWVEIINQYSPASVSTQPGRGIANMKARAKKLGASLRALESTGRYSLKLEIPVYV